MESIIHANPQEYYTAINTTNDADEFTAFIEFMPSAIKASLTEAISMSDGISDEIQDKALMIRRDRIEPYLKTHDYTMNADVRMLCGVSADAVNRILAGLVQKRHLIHMLCRWAFGLSVNRLLMTQFPSLYNTIF